MLCTNGIEEIIFLKNRSIINLPLGIRRVSLIGEGFFMKAACSSVCVPQLKPCGSPNTGWESSMCSRFPTPVHTVIHTSAALPASQASVLRLRGEKMHNDKLYIYCSDQLATIYKYHNKRLQITVQDYYDQWALNLRTKKQNLNYTVTDSSGSHFQLKYLNRGHFTQTTNKAPMLSSTTQSINTNKKLMFNGVTRFYLRERKNLKIF